MGGGNEEGSAPPVPFPAEEPPFFGAPDVFSDAFLPPWTGDDGGKVGPECSLEASGRGPAFGTEVALGGSSLGFTPPVPPLYEEGFVEGGTAGGVPLVPKVPRASPSRRPEPSYQCGHCQKTFSSRKNYTKHMFIHSGKGTRWGRRVHVAPWGV